MRAPSTAKLKLPGMNYTHLTQDERYQIYILKKAGHDQSEIAVLIKRSESTISRELARNRGKRGYRPKQAQQFAHTRMQACANAPRLAEHTWAFAKEKLALQWSPEQIAGFLEAHGQPTVSHETVYQRVYADQRAGGTLWRNLRCQKQRRKRYGYHDRRGAIPDRVSIEQRPAVVDTRSRTGDWEGDTIIGAKHQQALVSLIERKSRYALLAKVGYNSALEVGESVVSLLDPYRALVHTLTTDNGREFAGHATIANALEAKFYFAHAYASWERGANENLNGLVRQYFPKKMRFDTINQSQIDHVTHRLNHRPRKCLGFKTPHEVFMKSFNGVALRG
jgi:IS30 family transposase